VGKEVISGEAIKG